MAKWNAEKIWREYEKADSYNQGIDLYDTVEKNENFYIGKQWEGLSAPDLEKPVLNFLRRVVNYFISMIVSDDVAASLTPFLRTEESDLAAAVLGQEIERVIERTNAKSMHRDLLRNMAVDGDGCFYLYFDPEVETGQAAKGEICIDTVENTRILFGNPHEWEVQRQPCIFIVFRQTRKQLIAEAARFGIDASGFVKPGRESRFGEKASGMDDLTTVVIVLEKNEETGTVWAAKATEDGFIRHWWDTGYKLYPVAYASWDKVRGSYHGQAAVTGLIPNQVFVNKLWAMAMEQVKSMAFPKVIYNKALLPGGWTNGVGKALGVMGNPNEAVASGFRAPDMSSQVLELVQRTIDYTRDFMGASDAALGNVRPDNTSAIIAVQKASSVPLELQRLAFYQFVEDYVRVIIDMIRVHYGVRTVSYTDPNGEVFTGDFDFSQVNYEALQLKVDVGSSAYWSEIMQLQTLDNLYGKGIITDAITYLEGIPESYIKNRNRIIAKLKEQHSSVQELASYQTGLEE